MGEATPPIATRYETHLNGALAHVAKVDKFVQQFAARCKGGTARVEQFDLVLVLRAVLVSDPNRRWRSVSELADDLWGRHFKDMWGKKATVGGNKWTTDTFKSVLELKVKPPGNDWSRLFEQLAKECTTALAMREDMAMGFLKVLERDYPSLENCMRAIFSFAAGKSAPLRPKIDALNDRPFWQEDNWTHPPPHPAKTVDEVIKCLREGAKRIVFVKGGPFSAKRDVLKGVIGKLSSGYLPLPNGTPVPICAQAVDAISVSLFVDRVFDFYGALDSADPSLRRHLSTEAKVAFIRAAAKRNAAFFVVSDVEDLSQDAIVRRVRGDIIGDVLEAVVDGHQDSRLLIGLSTQDALLPWQEHAVSFELPPSREEFALALKKLGERLRRALKSDRLSGLTMRLAYSIIAKPTSKDTLLVPDVIFADAVNKNSPDQLMALIWQYVLSPRDKVLLGLIASSRDGLLLTTLLGLLGTLKRLSREECCNPELLDDCPDDEVGLSAWWQTQRNFVRPRTEIEPPKGKGKFEGFYMREPIRLLVLERWMKEHPQLARDGLWCIAREASDQAKQALLLYGKDGREYALGRHLQALHALLASIDPKTVYEAPLGAGARRTTARIASSILPPLKLHARRPDPLMTYQYAWQQLYKRDIEVEEHRLNLNDDSLARMDALLPFISPDTPWVPVRDRSLCKKTGEPIDLTCLGLAASALPPAEQVDLLTGLAIAALRTRQFHIVRDAARMGQLLLDNRLTEGVRLSDLLHLFRAEIELGILCGGNPEAKLSDEFCPGNGTFDTVDHLIPGVSDRIRKLISQLEATDARNPVSKRAARIAIGKLQLRLGEVHLLTNEPLVARQAFRRALVEDRELARRGEDRLIEGRGAHLIARYCIERALTAPCDKLIFASDGLKWPTQRLSSKGERWLRCAEKFIDVNRERVGRGYWVDRIGVFIDQARVCQARSDFDTAIIHVNKAIDAMGTSSPNFETALELGSFRVLLYIETAMRMATSLDGTARAKFEELQIQLARAVDALATLLDPSLAPYESLLIYLKGQSTLVATRVLAPHSEQWRAKMAEAEECLRSAASKMEMTGYHLHLPRVKETLEAIEQTTAAP